MQFHTYATQLQNAFRNKFRLLVAAGLLPGSIDRRREAPTKTSRTLSLLHYAIYLALSYLLCDALQKLSNGAIYLRHSQAFHKHSVYLSTSI
jgi:hypothetical protein